LSPNDAPLHGKIRGQIKFTGKVSSYFFFMEAFMTRLFIGFFFMDLIAFFIDLIAFLMDFMAWE
jgi:hypothetical protein